jgi:hypothetical protein
MFKVISGRRHGPGVVDLVGYVAWDSRALRVGGALEYGEGVLMRGVSQMGSCGTSKRPLSPRRLLQRDPGGPEVVTCSVG